MKIRTGFVSNSSSSSFIIGGDVSPDKLKVVIDLSKFGTILTDISKLNMKELFPNPSNPLDWIEKIAMENLQNNKTIFLGSMETTLDETLDILQNTKSFKRDCDSDGETTDFIICADKITEDDLKVEVDLTEFGKMLPGTVVFTGKMSVSREEAKEQAESLGCKVRNDVTKNTDLLVFGNDPGSKYQKAIDVGAHILYEEEWNMIVEALEENEKIFYGNLDWRLVGILDKLDETLESNIISEEM